MKKIIGKLNPFDMQQTFLVYEDGNKIDIMTTTIPAFLSGSIFDLMEKHNTHQLDLVGPKAYTTGIKEQLMETNMSKYNYTDLQINII